MLRDAARLLLFAFFVIAGTYFPSNDAVAELLAAIGLEADVGVDPAIETGPGRDVHRLASPTICYGAVRSSAGSVPV